MTEAKRIAISVPEDMNKKIEKLKAEHPKKAQNELLKELIELGLNSSSDKLSKNRS